MTELKKLLKPGEPFRWIFLLPLAGYLIYLMGIWEGHPNPKWALVLLLWSIVASAIAWALVTHRVDRLLEITERYATAFAITVMVVVLFGFMAISVWQMRNFAAGAQAEDTAYYSQVLWNTLHGHLLNGNLQQARIFHPPVINDLALHVSPFLLVVLLPFYALFPSALMLLLIRDLFLVAAAWPLFLIVREKLGGTAGLSAVVLYLANPVVIAQGMESFYLLHFAPLPFFFALRAFDREKYGLFWLWTMIALGVREDVSITLMGFGAMMIFLRRKWKWVAAGFVPSGMWWFITTLVIQPFFGHAGKSALDAGLAGGQQSPAGAYGILLSGPAWIFDALRKGAFSFLYSIFRSVAFLSFFGWEIVLAGPVLAATLFLGHVYYQGNDPLSRFGLLPSCALIGSAILIVMRMGRTYEADKRVFALLLFILLPSACLLDGAKNAVRDRFSAYTVQNDAAALRDALRLIPSNASVAAPNYALPALSKRHELFYIQYFYMYPDSHVDFFLFDNDLHRITARPEVSRRYIELRDKLASDPNYEKIWEHGDYFLMHRRSGDAKSSKGLSTGLEPAGSLRGIGAP
jgi:hypothetical protein